MLPESWSSGHFAIVFVEISQRWNFVLGTIVVVITEIHIVFNLRFFH